MRNPSIISPHRKKKSTEGGSGSGSPNGSNPPRIVAHEIFKLEEAKAFLRDKFTRIQGQKSLCLPCKSYFGNKNEFRWASYISHLEKCPVYQRR